MNQLIVQSDKNQWNTKCPACVVAAGILISQGICTLSAGGEHAYCNTTCRCGVGAVSSTCVLGFRSTSCQCYPCPILPIPPETYPSGPGPGWSHPYFLGTPWIDYGGAFNVNPNGD
jgi:hypothetical protein